MAYVQRDGNGTIIAAADIPLGIMPEHVADDDPALLRFLLAQAVAQKQRAVDGLLQTRLAAGMAYTYQAVSNRLQADPVSQSRFTAIQAQVSAGIALPAGFA